MIRPKSGIFAFGVACVVSAGLSTVAQAASVEGRVLQPALAHAADYSAVYPTNVFPAGTREIVVVFRLAPGETFKSFTGQFIAVDVGKAAPPNFFLARAEVTPRKSGNGDFHLDLPRPFPAGRYRLDVMGDGRPWKSVEFTVAAVRPAPASLLPLNKIMPLADGQSWTYDFLLETGRGVHLKLDNAKADADGKFRGTETERVLGHDAAGAHIEMRLGPTPLEEWWRLSAEGLIITQRKIQGQLIVVDPPQLAFPWPPNGTQSWDWRHKDPAVAVHQSSHMWGPLPVPGPKGPAPGFVVLTQEEEPNTPTTTFEREYLPGFGKVHEVLIEAVNGNLLIRQELMLKR